MKESKNEFVKVSHERDIEKLRQALASGKVEFTCTTAEKMKFLFRGVRISDGGLVAEPIDNSVNIPTHSTRAVLLFSYESEQYFLKSILSGRFDGLFFFDLSDTFFRLQRRKDFRVDVPETRKLYFRLKPANTTGVFDHDFPILDMSRSGMAIRATSQQLSLGAVGKTVSGDIMKEGDEVFFGVKAEIRLIRSLLGDPSGDKRIGLMFTEFNERQVMALVMDLYRERFSRYGNR